MERTGGDPDVVGFDKKTGEYIFYDCSSESPGGRRCLCYDREALDARKEHKPANSAIDIATAMGVELLSEEQYRELQKLEISIRKRRAGFNHLLILENSAALSFVIAVTPTSSFITTVRTY